MGKRTGRLVASAGLLATTIGLGPAPVAAATEVLDQQQLTSTGGTFSPTIAQTFTAGMSGDLTRIRLYLFRVDFDPSPAGTMTVEVRATESGAPTGNADAGTGTVLATEAVPVAEVRALQPPVGVDESTAVDVVFDDPAAVVAGTSYAIVLVQDTTVAFWLQYAESGTNGPYAAGQRWSAPSGAPFTAVPVSDAAFQTYVAAAPETDPAVLAAVVGDAAAALDPAVWRSAGTANAFASRIDGIMSRIGTGDLTGARSSAEDLRRRVDGCGSSASPDDWIQDCGVQTEIRALLDDLIAALTP